MIKRIFNPKGFTLIELIIVFTVIAILSVGGIAAFVSYSQTQSLSNDRENIITILNLAKANTTSQLKSTSSATCNGTLEGYSVIFTTSGANANTYNLYVRCTGNTASLPLVREVKINNTPYKLSKGITFITSGTNPMNVSSVFFTVLTGGIVVKNNIGTGSIVNCNDSSPCRIVINGFSKGPKTITIDSSGSIK